MAAWSGDFSPQMRRDRRFRLRPLRRSFRQIAQSQLFISVVGRLIPLLEDFNYLVAAEGVADFVEVIFALDELPSGIVELAALDLIAITRLANYSFVNASTPLDEFLTRVPNVISCGMVNSRGAFEIGSISRATKASCLWSAGLGS